MTLTVSIHASVKDATCTPQQVRGRRRVSIHASVKDATAYWVAYVDASPFQSTRP